LEPGPALMMGKQIQFFIEPFHRMFFINNINILYPHTLHERVPVSWNIIYAGVVPFICLVVWLAIARSSVHKFHVTILGLLIRLLSSLNLLFIAYSQQHLPHNLHHRRRQECCWAASTRLDISLQAPQHHPEGCSS
jgi:hypothetical protein